eukprot:scaffold144100_cov133-Phaeocystis_antarctica.AAC.1
MALHAPLYLAGRAVCITVYGSRGVPRGEQRREARAGPRRGPFTGLAHNSYICPCVPEEQGARPRCSLHAHAHHRHRSHGERPSPPREEDHCG